MSSSTLLATMSPAQTGLQHSLVIANGKGGVGKTTIAANLAIGAAAAGREVVAVDLDPEGGLSAELGLRPQDHDHGASLGAMVFGVESPLLAATSRPRLRCLAGGAATIDFAKVAVSRLGPGGVGEILLKALGPLAAQGAIVYLDTPGASADTSVLTRAALNIASWALIPTRTDRNSRVGVAHVLDQLSEGTAARPVGVVLFDVNPRANALKQARAQLNQLLDGRAALLRSAIRHADKAQFEAKERGLGATEYAALTNGRSARPGESAQALANDYTALVKELAAITGEELL